MSDDIITNLIVCVLLGAIGIAILQGLFKMAKAAMNFLGTVLVAVIPAVAIFYTLEAVFQATTVEAAVYAVGSQVALGAITNNMMG